MDKKYNFEIKEDKIMKKFLGLLLTISILCGLLSISAFANESTTSSSINVESKNFNTDEITTIDIPFTDDANTADAFIPENMDLNSSVQPRDIIGEDDRTRVPTEISSSMLPFSGVGLVVATFGEKDVQKGTGWLFGPNDVATSAHITYSKEYGFPTEVRFYPAQNGALGPKMGYIATNLFVPSKYINGDGSYDYSVFELNSNLGNTYGYFGWDSAISEGEVLHTVGYPGDKPKYEMWFTFGSVSLVYPRHFRHLLDTYGGQSGSPLYTPSDKRVRGIHRKGNDIDNIAIRITTDFANLLSSRR